MDPIFQKEIGFERPEMWRFSFYYLTLIFLVT